MRSKSKSLIVSLLLSSSMLASVSAFADKIKNIDVFGNERVEKETIINYISLKTNQDFEQAKLLESVKELYKTDLFNDVSIKFLNGVLQVYVKETPLITKVQFNGNSRIKTGVLSKEIISHQGSSLRNSDVKLDVEKIKEIYRKSGRYAINVTSKIDNIGNNRVKLIFDIAEGPKTGIRYINFVGNNNYKDSELRSIIITKQSAWFRFMDSSDTYDPDRVEYDKYLLKRFYNSIGYADFRIISAVARLSSTRENFTLTYTIEEGDQYTYGDVDVASNVKEIDAKQFSGLISIKKGRIYNASELEAISELINDRLADMGYTGAIIYPEERKDKINKTISIKFIIEKASKTYLDKININGNLKTRDSVIRRQFKISEGDLFNRSAIVAGERNIRNLDYFETVAVDVEQSPSGNNKADVNINVEEKSTSSIQFEVGYNSMEGPVGRVNFVERNLLGTGRYLTIGVDKYRKKISQHIGITDPYFMDKELLFGGSVFRVDAKSGSEHTPYSIKSVGGNLRAGYELATDLRHDIFYTLKRDEIGGGTRNSPSIFIREQYGVIHTSSIANSLTYDKLDSTIVPKNGYIVSFTETDAGLGGDNKFVKHEIDFKIFKSFFNNDYTVKIAVDAGQINGWGGKKVRIGDRTNLGDYSFRGFAPAGIGPRVKGTNEALGGKNYYTITPELLFPLGLPKEFNVSGALFSDIGSLWGFDVIDSAYSRDMVNDSSAPRVSVGMGILWVTRFAPIRLDYAIPIKKQKFDETQRWTFRFSTSF